MLSFPSHINRVEVPFFPFQDCGVLDGEKNGRDGAYSHLRSTGDRLYNRQTQRSLKSFNPVLSFREVDGYLAVIGSLA